MIPSSHTEDRDAHADPPLPAPHWNAKPGELISFGAYPQTADGADRTPIRWRVLQNTGSTLFLLSEYILDCKRYHAEFVDISWRDCDLRQWLNGEFFRGAFTPAEQALIQTTCCSDNGAGRPDTEDQVFLPGVDEVRELTEPYSADPSVPQRRAIGTEFARVKKTDGCHLYVYDKRKASDYLSENGQRLGCSWWWLRTQPGSPDRAAFIGTQGSVRSYCRVNRVSYGVRPAIRLIY